MKRKQLNKYSITLVPRDGSRSWDYGDYIVGYRNAVRIARQHCEDFFKKTGERIDFCLEKLDF